MKKWIWLLACLVLGLASVTASNLLAETEAPKPVVKTSSVPIQHIQKMWVLQQQQEMRSSLFKKYQERDNIAAALDTIEKRRAQSKVLPKSSILKDIDKQEKFLKERQSSLVAEIDSLEKKLKQKK